MYLLFFFQKKEKGKGNGQVHGGGDSPIYLSSWFLSKVEISVIIAYSASA